MVDLRIVDAPSKPTEDITGEEKLPTGGSGNYSVTLDSVADFTTVKKDLADNSSVNSKVNGVRQELDAHIEDLLNPHQVTKGQIGLGNVDNTADLDKPVSNSTQSAIITATQSKADKTYVDNQLTLKANKVDVYTKQESSDLVNNSISTALTGVNASLDLAKRGIANRHDLSLTYNSGERVVLTNGDIVKSTVDGNVNNPDVDLTGWDFVNKIVDFEAIGGVGDGNYLTGSGTDNASAFSVAMAIGERGFTIRFKPFAQYKTTSEIIIHNMRWVGDKNSTPIIFGWFSTSGKCIIRKNASTDKKTASIDGVTIWRCGQNPEHGINIDNMAGFYFRGKVLGVPFCNGGAIGVSAFYDANRPSQNVHIDAYLEQTGDYGVEFGDVQHGSLRVNGQNVWREIIGFEPIMRDVFEITSGMFADSTFTVANHGMITGDPVIYFANTNTALFENSRYYFAIVIDSNNFKIADTRKMAYSNLSMTSDVSLTGTHLIARCGIVEDIDVLSCILNDLDSVKPPLFGNFQGYVVLTATSGGWIGNINFTPIQITSNRRTVDGLTTTGIRIDGCSDLTIKNPTVNGCETSLRFLRGDVGNWTRKNRTKITPLGTCTIKPRRNVVINPVLKDFKVQGIYAQHDNNQFIGGSVQSNFVGAIGINDTTNLAGTTYTGGMVVDCPRGTDLTALTGVLAQDLRLVTDGKLINSVDLFNSTIATTKPKLKKSGDAIIALKSTNPNTNVSYMGDIEVLVSTDGTTSGSNKALYKLQVTKAFSGATPTVALLSSYGLTAGASSNHPSFTFSIVNDELIATAVGSTSSTNNFYFSIKTNGFISFI